MCGSFSLQLFVKTQAKTQLPCEPQGIFEDGYHVLIAYMPSTSN